jgi:spore maturation protein CgeB
LLKAISDAMPIDVFSDDLKATDLGAQARLHPAIWGLDMYRAIAETRIVLNTHLDDAGAYANNIRLYEVPGLGALQLTDRKTNLGEIFAIDREVAAYDGPDECIAMAKALLADEPRRAAIAAAGQRRIQADHTLRARTAELSRLIASL